MSNVRDCTECRNFYYPKIRVEGEFNVQVQSQMVGLVNPVCRQGHVLKFYLPQHGNDTSWGYKKKCDDFI